MRAPHRYPVGIQSFEEIRTKGYLYADKTALVWDLIQTGGKYRFLSRPRRFGKTLLVSTLEAYFRGRHELFEGLASELGVSPDECRARLKQMYDGYRFSEAPAEIYNPFSLMMALSNRKLGSYWFGSGTPTSLVEMLRTPDVALPKIEGVRAPASAFDAPTEGMDDPVAFMCQSGYFTIKEYDRLVDSSALGIPNREVAKDLSEVLRPVYTGGSGTVKDRRAGEERPTSADALAQIDDRGYLVPWEAGDKPVVKVGVCFSEEQRTIDENWQIAEA